MNKSLNWDSTITTESQFSLLTAGEANFEVTEFNRKFSEKTNCPMAEITLKLTKDGAYASISDFLVLSEKAEWKISSFFRATGDKKHGVAYKPDWQLIGKQGKCILMESSYKDKYGEIKKTTKIKEYVDATATTTKQDAPDLNTELERIPF